MQKHVLYNVLTAGLLVIAAISSAFAGQSARVSAKVPFAFTIGKESLPAGTYTFYENANGLIRIQNTQGDAYVYATNPGTTARVDGQAKFIFHRYDEQYFLSEVFNGTEDSSRKFAVSKLEKDLIGAASQAVAENSQPRDVVIYGTR
jgi:hypothetical protein